MQTTNRVRTGWIAATLFSVFVMGALLGRSFTLLTTFNPLSMAEMSPSTIRSERASDISSPADLKPLATFWEVRDKIKRNFVYPIEDDTKLTYGAIRGMLEALEDPYSRFMTPEEYKEFQSESEGHFSGIGAVLDRYKDAETDEWKIVISSILPEGPASKTALRPQDEIIAVDGKSVEGMPLSRVVSMIRGEAGTTVKLTVRRKNQRDPINIEIVRGDVEIPVVEYEMLPGNIGYVWLRNFNRQAPAKMRQALEDLKAKGMKGLVLDLSLDPGGILDVAIEIGNMFVGKGPLVWIRERGAEPEPIMAQGNPIVPPDVPMVCLIDGGSASASEILAGLLQDTNRAVICGQHSFGKAGVQTVIELNDGSSLVLTTAVYLTPKKRDISQEWAKGKRGVKPDVEFPEPDPEQQGSYTEWHEQQKKRALEVLRQHMAAKAAAQG